MKKIALSVLLLLVVQDGYTETTASFQIQATIENGCELNSNEQLLDFGRHALMLQNHVNGSVINTAQTWNIQCTARLPVMVMLNGGDYFSNNSRRLKHELRNDFIAYRLYQTTNLQNEYVRGNTYPLTSTTSLNSVLNFSVYGVADLNNNNQPRSAGRYKDTVAITITW